MPAPILPDALIDCGYRDLARRILKAFLEDYSNEELSAAVSSAYDAKFDAPDIVPLRALSDGWLMELWHGPTCAFKDIALTILPHLMSTAYQDARMATSDLNEMAYATHSDKVNIIVETGGAKQWQNSVISSKTNQLWKVADKGLLSLNKNMIAGIAGIFHLLLTIGLILLYQCCQKVLPQ